MTIEEEYTKLKNKLDGIKTLCTVIGYNEDKIKISMIEEILEDKKDIHYYLESEEK